MSTDTEIFNYLDIILKGNGLYGATDIVIRGNPHNGGLIAKLPHGTLEIEALENSGAFKNAREAIRSLKV